MPNQSSPELLTYYASGKPLVCKLEENPYFCEIWPLDELVQYNQDYEVLKFSPGYFGFATSGCGEMFALSPEGAVVCLPFIGMEPSAAIPIALSWSAFEGKIRNVL